MGKIKVVVTAILFLASCVSLAVTNGVASEVLAAYPASVGASTPLFSAKAISLMQNSAAICFGALAVSVALGFLAILRAKSRETKLYWVTALAVVNYHVSAMLLATMAVGFFLLPKLANGT